MSQLKRLILEIHRRSLWQVLGIYIVSAWVIWQVVGSMYEWMGLPDWVPPTTLTLLLVGLPVVLATAFVQEGLPGLDPDSARAGGGAARVDAAGETSGAEAVSPRTDRPTERPFLTWNRVVVAAVLAFAALGVAVSGFMGMRALGIGPSATLISSGQLGVRDPIVLADFAGTAADPTLGDLVTEALRVDLAESPVISLVPPERVEDSLERMRRDPAGPLDEATARELAVREGLAAVLAGEVREAAGSYVLTARVVTPDSGRDLAAFRATARDSSHLISAIDSLSTSIREEVGESLRSVRASEPLERVTTHSLQALRLYSQGDYLGAVALDSTFAMAWRKVAVLLSNNGVSRTGQIEAATRAYELRDRLPPRERGLAEWEYHTTVTGDFGRAEQALRAVLASDPDSHIAHNNLGYIHSLRGHDEQAVEEAENAYELAPSAAHLVAVAWDHRHAGRPDRALALLDSAESTFPASPSVSLARAGMLAGLGRYEESDSAAAEARSFGAFSATLYATVRLAANDAIRGRLDEALTHLDELAETIRGSVYADILQAELIEVDVVKALYLAGIRGDTARARQIVDRALTYTPLDDIPPLDRPYGYLAEALAFAGDTDRALRLSAAYDSVAPGYWTDGDDQFAGAGLARGIVSLREDRPEEALRQFWRVNDEVVSCHGNCALPLIARAHEMAGKPDSAIATYEGYLRVVEDQGRRLSAIDLPLTLQRLPVLYEARGEREKAARLYARFIDLWEDADPELQPRVEAARRALVLLTAEGPG